MRNYILGELDRNKELMKYNVGLTLYEQAACPVNGRRVTTENCANNMNWSVNCVTVDGQVPQVGQFFAPTWPGSPASVKITNVTPGTGTAHHDVSTIPACLTNLGGPGGGTPGPYMFHGCQTGNSSTNFALTTVTQPATYQNPQPAMCNQPGAGCPSNTSNTTWIFYGDQTNPSGTYNWLYNSFCQGNAPVYPGVWNPNNWWSGFWNNLQSKPWVNNSGQPCQFLTNRIQIWQNKLNSAGPKQQNMLNKKIEFTQYRMIQENC